MNELCRCIVSLVLIFPFGLTGCMTHELRTIAKSDSSYNEEVSSILMSEDGKHLVFIGAGHHYVFDASIELLNSLRSPFRKSMFAKFKDFRADINNQVVGTITIYLDESATQEEKSEAIKLGYEEQLVGPALEITIFGHRYKSGDANIEKAGYKLNYTYHVKVYEERGSLEKAALTAATPITVLADGAMFLIGVPLVVLLGISPN